MLGGLVLAGAQAHGGLAPRRLRRHAGRRLALATTVRVVARVHHHAAHLRPAAHVARAPGLADVLVLVVQVAHLADGGHALDAHAAHLARRQADGGHVPLLGQQGRAAAGAAHDLAAATGDQLDVVDPGCRAGCATAAARCRPAPRRPAPEMTVSPTPGRAAAACSACRRRRSAAGRCAPSGSGRTRPSRSCAGTPALSRFQSITRYRRLWPRALVADGELALAVAAGAAHQPLGERLVRLSVVISSNVERVIWRRPGDGGSVVAKWHRLDGLEEFDLSARRRWSPPPSSSRGRCPSSGGRGASAWA